MKVLPFKILGEQVLPGTRQVLEVEVAKLHTRNSLSMPVIVEHSDKPGPVLLIMAGVHGDEVNGVAIVREIIRQKLNVPSCGTVICLPVFNVFGYLKKQREFPDGRDLNRVFPGAAKGSLASQFAYTFTKEIAPLVDYVLDFHTGGKGIDNYPNIRCAFKDEKSMQLGKIFGAPFLVHSNTIPKSIRATLSKLGKTILLFEGGKSLEINKSVIDCGVQGTKNVMEYLNMIPSSDKKVDCNSVVVVKSSWVRSPNAGLFESLVANGSWVESKQIIGRISDPYGDFEKNIKAPHDSFIYGLNTSPIVNKGDALFHVSTEMINN